MKYIAKYTTFFIVLSALLMITSTASARTFNFPPVPIQPQQQTLQLQTLTLELEPIDLNGTLPTLETPTVIIHVPEEAVAVPYVEPAVQARSLKKNE